MGRGEPAPMLPTGNQNSRAAASERTLEPGVTDVARMSVWLP